MYQPTSTNIVCIQLLKLMISPLLIILWIMKRIIKVRRENNMKILTNEIDSAVQEYDADNEIEEAIHSIINSPELPEMCQIFNLGKDTILGIQFVSMCPDETAHVRIIGDTTFSQLYKRKVHYEKTFNRDRYIIVSGKKFYLDPKKTKPIDPIQDKKGK